MGVAINNSLDWNSEMFRLQLQIMNVGYNRDLQKMYNNISKMVTELSKLEVEARRTRKETYVKEKVAEINKAIDHLEKLLLVAQLMR